VKTASTELFGIQHPISRAACIRSLCRLAGGRIHAGGLGIITGLPRRRLNVVAKESAHGRDITDKRSRNLTLPPSFPAPPYPEYIAADHEGGVKAGVTAGRSP